MAQIEASKLIQQDHFARWKTSNQGPFADVPDLKADLRPKIDKLSTALLEALAKAQPHLPAATVQQRLKAGAPALLIGEGITGVVRDRALQPLLMTK